MGEIADMMLDGILDEQTGEYIGNAVGYPRTRQQGFYNSIKKRKKSKRDVKHAMKGLSLGGLHLVGQKVIVDDIGECVIKDYVGKRGGKRYVLIDKNGNKHRKKFSAFTLYKNK